MRDDPTRSSRVRPPRGAGIFWVLPLMHGALDPCWMTALLALAAGAAWFSRPGRSADKTAPETDPAREARALRGRGEFLRAGELFERAGQLDQAAEMYRKSAAWKALARVSEAQKNWLAAAAAYESAGDFDRAQKMFERGGHLQKAAALLEVTGRVARAAALFEQANEFQNAARLYERAGETNKAAAVFERLGQPVKAAELYERHCLQEMARLNIPAGGATPSQQQQIADIARECSRLYLKIQQPAKAAKLLLLGGFVAEAAEICVADGDLARAATLYRMAHQNAKAAELYRRLGDTREACRITAEMHLDADDPAAAAEMYAQAGDFKTAADCFRRAGRIARAGELYLQAGEPAAAAASFEQAGDLARAAEALERAGRTAEAAERFARIGEHDRALGLFVQAEDFFRAGLLCRAQGKIDAAIGHLQRVGANAPEFVQASELLGEIFKEQGMLDAARERLVAVVERSNAGSHVLESCYQLALVYEDKRDYRDAGDLYEKILAHDISFRDTKVRLQRVQDKLTHEPRAEGGAAPNGRYHIGRKLGQGGMGVVYLAEDTLLHRTVAYKALPVSVKSSPEAIENFLQEARFAAAMNHPNIVALYDAGTEGDEPYLIMEYVDGMTLKEILGKTAGLDVKRAVWIASQICAGLDYAHSKGVIHRDIKPANVMVSRERVVKIMDFGLAKLVTAARHEGTGIKGTPLYMSPEQIRGDGVDHRTDIYAFGCTLYRLVTGRPPFTDGDIYYHHLNTEPRPPRDLNPKLPAELDALILRCIEKDPTRRISTVREIASALEHL